MTNEDLKNISPLLILDKFDSEIVQIGTKPGSKRWTISYNLTVLYSSPVNKFYIEFGGRRSIEIAANVLIDNLSNLLVQEYFILSDNIKSVQDAQDKIMGSHLA